MTTILVVNGNTYTDDDDPVTGMGAGGFRTRLLPMLSDTMIDVGGKQQAAEDAVAEAEAARDAAAASAASALMQPGTSGTSTTSITPGTGPKTFTTQTGKNFVLGQFVTVSTADGSSWMNGAITAYNSATGEMTVRVSRYRGVAASSWSVTVSAPGVPDYGGSAIIDISTTGTSPGFGVGNARYEWFTASRAGAAVDLSNSEYLEGCAVFAVRNQVRTDYSDFPYDVKLAAGLSSGGFGRVFMSPGSRVVVDGTGSQWHLTGGSPYGTLAIGQVTFSSSVAGTSGLYTKSLRINDTFTVILVHGASLHAVAYDSVDRIFGAPVLVRSALGAAGSDGDVAMCLANNLGTGGTGLDVLVVSVNGTALQSVVLTLNSSTNALSLGPVTSTTLASAWTRIVELVGAPFYPNASYNQHAVLGLVSATSASMATMAITSGNSVVVGGTVPFTIVNSIACLLPNTDNIVTVLTASTTTNVQARPYTISAVGVPTAGTLANLTVSSTTVGLAVRADGPVSSSSGWYVTHLNSSARVSYLTVTGTTATFSTATVMNLTITSVTGIYTGGKFQLEFDYLPLAISGTNATGLQTVEGLSVSNTSGVPYVSTRGVIYTGAATTATWLKEQNWQLTTATEAIHWTPGIPDISEWRMPGAVSYAQMATPLDLSWIKATRPRNLLRSGKRALTVLDGTKPSMLYGPGLAAEPTNIPVRLINTAQNSFSYNNYANLEDSIWAAAGPAPSTTITLQCLQLL